MWLLVNLANLALANLVPWRPGCGSQNECEAEASGMLALYLDRMTRGAVFGEFFCLGSRFGGSRVKGNKKGPVFFAKRNVDNF